MAFVEHGGDTRVFAHWLVVGRSDHVDGCPIWGPGCSRRMGIDPLLVRKSPWLLFLLTWSIWVFDLKSKISYEFVWQITLRLET
jgi:hypothetical protein